MEKITTKQIRNVCLLGHGGNGKTAVAEALLYIAKATDRLGKTADGTSVCDYDSEEIKRGLSLSTSIAPMVWRDVKINLLDTPGFFDFVGEVYQALRVSDSSVIVIDCKSGIEAGTELSWERATEMNVPKSIFINKVEDPDADFFGLFRELKDKYGRTICPLCVPIVDNHKLEGFINLMNMHAYTCGAGGVRTTIEIPDTAQDMVAEYRDMLLEAVAETNEDLMAKYFEGETMEYQEIVDAVHEGIISGDITPVFCGSCYTLANIDLLLELIASSYPRHTAKKNEQIIDGDSFKDMPIDPEGPTALFVFKTIADPFVGKMSFFKVMNGELRSDMVLKNADTGIDEKFAHIYTIRGKKQTEVDVLCCGDIGMVAKLNDTYTNDTLTNAPAPFRYKKIVFPEPFLQKAIKPKAKGDEDKISGGIARLLEEDLTLRYENNAETKQLLISGLGDIHLDVLVSKLKSRYGTSVDLDTPKIAYREAIKKTVQAEGKHKKQSGGHGQYGHVRIEFGPGEEDGLTFTESVVGGAVPKGFFPAVEKGLQEAMLKGVLAGFPMVNLKANLYDGSYHDVDSSEMAFKIAANLAYKAALPNAAPVILEPVGALNVVVPDDMVGDVIGDVNKRRGRVLGMNAHETKKGYQVVEAEVPKSEMMDYPIVLRAFSQGKGSFTFYFVRYEEVPMNVAQKIIAEAKKDEE